MPFVGKQLQPKEIAALCHTQGWRDLDLVKMVATFLAESQGYTEAFHENRNEAGELISKDIGVGQINIGADEIGTAVETKLLDPEYNVFRAWKLWERRKFQPWVAYTTGWATFSEWWVWTSAEPHHWAPTGRYIHKAVRGVAGFHADQFGVKTTIAFTVPLKPTEPPADGTGIRPIPNDGLT